MGFCSTVFKLWLTASYVAAVLVFCLLWPTGVWAVAGAVICTALLGLAWIALLCVAALAFVYLFGAGFAVLLAVTSPIWIWLAVCLGVVGFLQAAIALARLVNGYVSSCVHRT